MIDPAINVTIEILKSAARTPSIRRVVITSSMATLLTWEYVISDDLTKVFTCKCTLSDKHPQKAQT